MKNKKQKKSSKGKKKKENGGDVKSPPITSLIPNLPTKREFGEGLVSGTVNGLQEKRSTRKSPSSTFHRPELLF